VTSAKRIVVKVGSSSISGDNVHQLASIVDALSGTRPDFVVNREVLTHPRLGLA
jgi:hypothetical protein